MNLDFIEYKSILLKSGITINIKINHSHQILDKVLILAHGLSNDMENELLEEISKKLSNSNTTVIRFNFPFIESSEPIAKSKETIDDSFIEVIEFTQDKICQNQKIPLFIGGKSLGALVSARIFEKLSSVPKGLIFLGYPLHKPGIENQLRDEFLYSLTVPVYFFEGSKDPFCSLDKLVKILPLLKEPSLEVINNGGHSFENSSISFAEISSKIALLINNWMQLNLNK